MYSPHSNPRDGLKHTYGRICSASFPAGFIYLLHETETIKLTLELGAQFNLFQET